MGVVGCCTLWEILRFRLSYVELVRISEVESIVFLHSTAECFFCYICSVDCGCGVMARKVAGSILALGFFVGGENESGEGGEDGWVWDITCVDPTLRDIADAVACSLLS